MVNWGWKALQASISIHFHSYSAISKGHNSIIHVYYILFHVYTFVYTPEVSCALYIYTYVL